MRHSRNRAKKNPEHFQCRVVELLYLHFYCKPDATRAIRL